MLIVPVLQPSADSIPFGLALSFQSQASESLPGVGAEHDQEDLYELQYVLEGQGEASTASKTPPKAEEDPKLKRLPGTDTDTLFLQMLQLCAKSGLLQSIAAGDSILAPIGRAWCQLDDKPTPKSDLAVLKLLVPGSLPHDTDAQQGDLVCLLYICLGTH